MSLLTLDIASCVRVSNKFSTCRECESACPVETIKIAEQMPSFIPNDCVGCGGCLAACPSAAYKLDDFSPINFIFSHLESSDDVVSCKSSNIPCLAALSVDEMLSMAILSNDNILFEKSHCAECSIAKPNLQLIEDRVEEVNFLLEAMELKKEIIFDNFEAEDNDEAAKKEALSRRKLLSKVNIKDAAIAKHKFENKVESLSQELKEHSVSAEDIKNIRQKKLPERRKLLSMAMKRVDIPSKYHNLDIEDVSFISQKVLDEDSCTNCQMCYRICPTGALSSNEHGAFIAFNAIECIKCQSCHDVCEPNSLTLKPIFSTKQLLEPKKELLVKFSIQRCNECGMPFAYRGGELMCDRCRIEEEEAHELWGMR
jgi:ferredoxin